MKYNRHNKIYILAGKWKYKKITIHNTHIRPTMHFIRETLFNWLINDISMLNCLDCFAGSGILSLEALSRNACSATLIENNIFHFKKLQQNISLFKNINIKLIYGHTLHILSTISQKFNLIFIDPPFSKDNFLLQTTCFLLEKYCCLNNNAYIYLEYMTSSKPVLLPYNWIQYRKKTFGSVTYALYKKYT
ncbi:16S rRNA (guanine(966)-N(2))-methyltransferase RsmD [Enterobacteriaceae endosymbiont of Macroplea appendiculata]|uniref:16S rRNA (guanine(966)-N(2))-methyltransferase RsmD n=1 Tax=Enterobacteriaceae endosymbiont of Macroplea appendiculata TaxID=2675790 RepID=UPI001448CD7F|nr:16S rRNA (guanine(966)-N(2))-methyltransferase RsmD [Enterobacteriaceae endosymbiont of Macroplea appendiculata]QJC30658.1 16S rRNA (guanine(966)-N(2))-methyltransferase RsmD [Enterobacteriaceae endosymbiont of Macroplea appendiculata]